MRHHPQSAAALLRLADEYRREVAKIRELRRCPGEAKARVRATVLIHELEDALRRIAGGR